MTAKPYDIKLIDNYQFDETASALQKSIRRSVEYDACYYAFILHESGLYKYVWKRLLIIASEDVGLATPEAAQIVHSLQQSYHYAITSVNRPKNDSLVFIFEAVLYLCRAKKTREVDSLVNLIRTRHEQGERLPVPEYAKDFHTRAGRAKLGNWQDGSEAEIAERHRLWFDEYSRVEPDMGDKYLADLKKVKGVK